MKPVFVLLFSTYRALQQSLGIIGGNVVEITIEEPRHSLLVIYRPSIQMHAALLECRNPLGMIEEVNILIIDSSNASFKHRVWMHLRQLCLPTAKGWTDI